MFKSYSQRRMYETVARALSSAAPSDSRGSFCCHRLFLARNETWRENRRAANTPKTAPLPVFPGLTRFAPPRRFRKKLERRGKAHAVFCRKFFFRKFGTVEIDDLARADNVELQHFEIRLHVVGNPWLRKIDEVRLFAIGAAS